MNNDEQSGLGISSIPQIHLSSDWQEFASGLSAAAVELLLKGPLEAASGGVASLVKFLASVRVAPNAPQRAWALATLSLAWALGKVKISDEMDHDHLVDLMMREMRKEKSIAENSGIFIPVSFLDRPTKLPLYRSIKDTILAYAKNLDNTLDIKEVGYRIDAAFNRAIFEIWSKRPEYYTPIVDAISIPGMKSADRSLSWDNYRAKLIYDFEVKPLFGQELTKISLSQLYVPLRCLWPKDSRGSAAPGQSDHSPEVSNIALLDDLLYSWLDDDNKDEWLRLIGGGPGSGKSTTLKSLAAYAAGFEKWRPLFIPLQHIDAEGDLRDRINTFFAEQVDGAFSHPPLSRTSVEDGAPLLLIFDGLDEMVAPGESAREIVATFANRLNSLVAALAGDGRRPIKVVVSGRMPSFQAARRYLTPPSGGALETYGFLPMPDADLAGPLWSKDQRPQWWRQYAKHVGGSVDVPEAFSSQRLEAITHEPLLCYLLALAGYATEHWEQAAENRNRIYAALVDSVYDRGWGEGAVKRHGPGRNMSKPDFNKLMETIALAAWRSGDARVASEMDFEEAVSLTEAKSAWDTFCKDNGTDITNLALNFYLKSSERSQRGFEFTHKSFGEYLAARAILSVADEIALQARRKAEYSLLDWLRVCRLGVITPETLHFIRDECRLRLSNLEDTARFESMCATKANFELLAQSVASDGFPLEALSSNWNQAQAERANAEACLWVIINSCSRALRLSGKFDSSVVEMDWSGEDDLNSVLRRLSLYHASRVVFHCLGNMRARDLEFRNLAVEFMDISGSDLRNSRFFSVSINAGNFEDVNINGCRFFECNIKRVSFLNCQVDGAIMQSTALKYCSYRNIDGKFVLSPASFFITNMDDLRKISSNILVMSDNYSFHDEFFEAIEDRSTILGTTEIEICEDLAIDLVDPRGATHVDGGIDEGYANSDLDDEV